MKPTDLDAVDPANVVAPLGHPLPRKVDTEAAERAAARQRSRHAPVSATDQPTIVVGPDGKLGTNLPEAK